MFKTKIAALAIAAVSVVGIGAGMAGTANAATIATTNFTFPSGTSPSSTLSVDASNPVPANGTAVTFDLQSFITNASVTLNGNAGDGVADTGTILADDITSAALGLEGLPSTYAVHSAFGLNTGTVVTGGTVPATDFTNLPSEVIPSTGVPTETDPVSHTVVDFVPPLTDNYNLAAADTTVTLYVEGATANTFEVSGTNGGTPLSFSDVAAIDPSLGSDVTWSEPSGTTVTTVPPTVHVHHTGTPTHTVNPNAPQLSHGQAVSVAPTRENVTFDLSSPSWVHFTIIGPGAINGHQGWVNGVAGTNTAYYEGLNSNSGYTVLYQPVTGQGSLTPVVGSHQGYVWFVTS
jgi:hypothetical protein